MTADTRVLRLLVLWGTLGAYLALWAWFFWVVWTTDSQPADLSPKALYAASSLGGILGSFFAVSLGIQRQDVHIDASELRLGRTLLGTPYGGEGRADAFATAGVYAYAIVGVAALVTVLFRSEQSPESLETMATVFGGLVLTLFASAFAPGQQGPGR
jgi:hypothetical protein